MAEMINVFVVDDSPIAQALLGHILSADPEIQVIGTAKDGEEALGILDRLNPDVITMDIEMPKLNGFETTRRIMASHPTPVVITSTSYTLGDADMELRAIQAGAHAILEKPRGIGHPAYEGIANEILQTVKRSGKARLARPKSQPQDNPVDLATPPTASGKQPLADVPLVAIGASVGGPLALQTILSVLPEDFTSPLLIAQCLRPNLLHSLIEQLGRFTSLRLRAGAHGELPQPGHAYFTPDGYYMAIASDRRIVLREREPKNGADASLISHLFRSVAQGFGSNAIGVLLTGVGKDGSKELKLMKESGAVTIVQDEESAVAYELPGEGIRLHAETHVLPPERIALMIESLVNTPSKVPEYVPAVVLPSFRPQTLKKSYQQ